MLSPTKYVKEVVSVVVPCAAEELVCWFGLRSLTPCVVKAVKIKSLLLILVDGREVVFRDEIHQVDWLVWQLILRLFSCRMVRLKLV